MARLAILRVQRETLILVPTIDLMNQWHQQLTQSLGIAIGLLGGGERQLEAVTVSTYDSGLLRMEQIGNRLFTPLALWQAQCAGLVTGQVMPAGHFIPEELPQATSEALIGFFS